ncbi:hypothetical protein HP2RS_05704, partial [Helicobacter pylori]
LCVCLLKILFEPLFFWGSVAKMPPYLLVSFG